MLRWGQVVLHPRAVNAGMSTNRPLNQVLGSLVVDTSWLTSGMTVAMEKGKSLRTLE